LPAVSYCIFVIHYFLFEKKTGQKVNLKISEFTHSLKIWQTKYGSSQQKRTGSQKTQLANNWFAPLTVSEQILLKETGAEIPRIIAGLFPLHGAHSTKPGIFSAEPTAGNESNNPTPML